MAAEMGTEERGGGREIPGDGGMPGVGHTLDFARDPLAFIQKRMARHGPVSWCSLFGKRVHVILGPEANEWLLKTEGASLSNREGWGVFLGGLFDRGLMLRDGAEHRAHRKIMAVAFKRSALEGYVDQMHPLIDEAVSTWGDQGGSMKLYPLIKRLTLQVASRVFLGLRLRRDSDRVNQAFIDTVMATMSLVRYPIPGGSYRKGLQGRAFLEAYLREILETKRDAETPDMLSRLCHAVSEDGEAYSDQDVIDHMVFLLMAAHDTSTTTLSCLLYELARHPEWQERLRGELTAGPPGSLSLDQMEAARDTSMAIREVLRLYPPVPTQPRLITRDLEYQGYRLPAGGHVAISGLYTHRMPELWPAPQSFDPLRFDHEGLRHEGHPYAWIPFGGGAHLCIGLHFASVEIKAVLHHVLSRYRVTVEPGYEMPLQVIPMMKPRDDLPVRLERL
jgi:cytochrome P450